MDNISSNDSIISTPRGRLFARQWKPAGVSGAVPIIFFHDSLGSVQQWRDFPGRVAAVTGRSVIAYDRLGFGKSDPNPDMLTPDFIRNEAHSGLRYVRDAFGIDRMILLGHSVGGGMAVAAAATFPEETDAVITLSAQAFVEDRTIEGIRLAKAAFQEAGQIERLARYHGDKAKWVLTAWTESWLASSFSDWSLDADLKSLRCPALVMHGDSDEYGSPAHPNRMAALAGGPVKVVLLKNCHHVPHRELPDEVIRLVNDFLRKS